MSLKVSEVFYSIQGEGYNTGMSAVFIRLSGCNLRCKWCDTTHQGGNKAEIGEIIRGVKRYKPCVNVVLTGGEPTIQGDYEKLIHKLNQAGFIVHLETNCTNYIEPWIVLSNWITLSPKSLHNIEQVYGDELKLVYTNQDLKKYQQKFDVHHYFLQPKWDWKNYMKTDQNVKKVINVVKRNPNWRLSCQTQKYLNIR